MEEYDTGLRDELVLLQRHVLMLLIQTIGPPENCGNSKHCACRVLIASIMEEYNKGAWEELIERCQEAGVDAFEINFSCPHGMPERKMGMAMGQDPEILQVHS